MVVSSVVFLKLAGEVSLLPRSSPVLFVKPCLISRLLGDNSARACNSYMYRHIITDYVCDLKTYPYNRDLFKLITAQMKNFKDGKTNRYRRVHAWGRENSVNVPQPVCILDTDGKHSKTHSFSV